MKPKSQNQITVSQQHMLSEKLNEKKFQCEKGKKGQT